MDLVTMPPPADTGTDYDGLRLLWNVLSVQLILATPALLWALYRWAF